MEPRVLADAVASWRPQRVRHRLTGDPLLDVDVVANLVDKVPAREVVHHLGNLPLLLPRGDAPALDLDAAEVARGIHDNSCWMRVGSLEHLPGWDTLLDDCLAAVGTSTSRKAQVFLASPGAITPAHFDGYHNLLLQVRGTKEVSIGTFTESSVEQREIARHFGPERENLRVLPTEVSAFRLEPGDGLYIPPYSFHWAKAGHDVSVALSCNFADSASERAGLVQLCNARLRRLGLDPAPFGRRPAVDRAKAELMRSWRAGRRWQGRLTRSSAAWRTRP